MVLIPVTNGWHEEQIDQLFSSLLGKGFQYDDTPNQEEQPAQTSVDLTGFGVFG